MNLTRLALAAALAAASLSAQNDWPTFGGNMAGTRFSLLRQITPANVANLQRAWTYHMNPARKEGDAPAGRVWGASPLVVKGRMYLTTPYNRVVAIEPETGKELWAYEVKGGQPAMRGLEFWAGDKSLPAQVFFGTSDGRLIALNAETGKPVPGFGNEGAVNLREGVMNDFPNAPLGLSSPPIVYKNVIITGAHTQEAPALGASGDTRAWDVRTGKLLWRFHNIPQPGEPGHETWDGESWKSRSGVNTWGFFTLDTTRGILYMPLGEPTSDYFGTDRKGANLYGTSLVAVDALTGKVKWHFQAVHHDIWDYDLAAPPVLMDVVQRGRKIPAVAQISKMGLLFILNRVTGKPIHGVEERAVPSQGALPGESPWPTQPFPLKPPPLARNSFSPADIATVTPEHEKFCRDLFALEGGAHYGGPYTLYTTKPSVIFPSSIGGGNWNPMSFDPRTGYLFVNTMDFGSFNKMVPAGAGGGRGAGKGGGRKGGDGVEAGNVPPPSPWSRQGVAGTNRFWDPATNLPCNQPPWGRLFAINVHTGDIAWESRLGITESLPAGQQLTGRPNLGGSVATAGGLVFIGATDDSRFRAFDSVTGKEVWVAQIDAGAHSAPISYRGKDGRQYISVVATGGGFLGDKSSADTVITFALPAK